MTQLYTLEHKENLVGGVNIISGNIADVAAKFRKCKDTINKAEVFTLADVAKAKIDLSKLVTTLQNETRKIDIWFADVVASLAPLDETSDAAADESEKVHGDGPANSITTA